MRDDRWQEGFRGRRRRVLDLESQRLKDLVRILQWRRSAGDF
jgi:hypothetical protein